MKTSLKILLGISSLLLAYCHQEPIVSDLTPREDNLVGRWNEIAEKIPFVDSTGHVIDSIDVRAEYKFLPDHRFTCSNENWMNATHGVWQFDSTEQELRLYPNASNPVSIDPQAKITDSWFIENLTDQELKVDHFHESQLPNDTVTVVFFRSFYKVH